MFVEDIFLAIRAKCFPNHRASYELFDGLLYDSWYHRFIVDVGNQIQQGNPLSSNQSRAILRLIAKVRHHLVQYGIATAQQIDSLLASPVHRQSVYRSEVILREVRHLGDNFLGFRFKQNPEIIRRIKEIGTQPIYNPLSQRADRQSSVHFDWTHKIWVVAVLRHTLPQIRAVIGDFGFGIDETTIGYLRQAEHSIGGTAIFLHDQEHDALIGTVPDDPLLAAWIVQTAGGVAL